MNKTPSRHLGRIGSSSTGLFQIIIYCVMLITSLFRLECAHGFFSRMTPSICSSLYLPHTRSFLASCTRTTTATPAIGANSLVRRKIQSPSSLASKSPSITEKSLDGFNSMSLSIPTMETMEEVGALIAILSQPTDVLFLDGDLGAGKTTFSRGFIKCKLGAIDDDCDDEEIDHSEHINSARVKQASLRITSPTYLLSNTYEYREDDDHSDEERTRE